MITLLRALRPLHWSKNILLFAPLVLAHHLADESALLSVAITFVSFSLAASATYLINDLADLKFDRAHPIKRTRGVASGALPAKRAATAAALLLIAAFAAVLTVSPGTAGLMAAYVALSIVYSLILKRFIFLDAIALSALWTLRILAGGVSANVAVSDWLLAFSVFMFVGLALLKRYADLALFASDAAVAAPGRGYVTGDRDLLRSMGVTSGYIAVLVLALYLTSPAVVELYSSPRMLWFACPLLLYWIAHMWFLAHRARIQDDPIIVAMKDPTSYVVGVLVMIVVFASV